MQERYARKNEAADLRRAFEILDSKHDGHIDAEELRDIFEKMNHKVKRVTFSFSLDYGETSGMCMNTPWMWKINQSISNEKGPL